MLRDKPRIIDIKLPAMSSTNTVTVKLDDYKISPAEQAAMKIFPLASGNFSVAKSKISGGNYKIVVTASGSVSANTKLPVLCFAGGVDEVVVAAVDA
jgi:hypothetical protein